jgi:hypothetical protein
MFVKSNLKDKRYALILPKKTIHFGSKNGFTYIDGATEKQKENYLKRHATNENWDEINSGSLARFILWNDRDLDKNIADYRKRFL